MKPQHGSLLTGVLFACCGLLFGCGDYHTEVSYYLDITYSFHDNGPQNSVLSHATASLTRQTERERWSLFRYVRVKVNPVENAVITINGHLFEEMDERGYYVAEGLSSSVAWGSWCNVGLVTDEDSLTIAIQWPDIQADSIVLPDSIFADRPLDLHLPILSDKGRIDVLRTVNGVVTWVGNAATCTIPREFIGETLFFDVTWQDKEYGSSIGDKLLLRADYRLRWTRSSRVIE